MVKLVHELDECDTTLSHLRYHADLNNIENLFKVIEQLPDELQNRWLRYATAIEQDGVEACFADLAQFVKDEALIVNSAFGRVFKGRQSKAGKVASHATSVSEVKRSETKCCYCSGQHFIHACYMFKQAPASDRWEFVKQKRRCFNCLKPDHA